MDLRYRTVDTPDGPVVLVPFLRDSWLVRDTRYRRRRAVGTAAWVMLTVATVGLSAFYVWGLSRSGTVPAVVFASVYGLLVVPGLVAGRRWLKRTPGRTHTSRLGVWGPTIFVFMPVFAGFGLAVLPALAGADFPGERTARQLTAKIWARRAAEPI
jgi:hypothetical protein